LKQPSWELGLICYEIVFEKYPFPDYSTFNAPNYHVEDVVFPPTYPHLHHMCPTIFLLLVQGLLKNNPQDRTDLNLAVQVLKKELAKLKEEEGLFDGINNVM